MTGTGYWEIHRWDAGLADWVVEIQDPDRKEVLELLRESTDPSTGRGAHVRLVSPGGEVVEECVRGASKHSNTRSRTRREPYRNPVEFHKEWGHIEDYEEVVGAASRLHSSADEFRHFQDYGHLPNYDDLIREGSE